MVRIEHPLYQEDIRYVSEYIKKQLLCDNRKTILIIGATGLIGSFLTDVFLYYNRHICNLFDIYAMGRNLEQLKKRFAYTKDSEICLWEHDINSPLQTNINFDYIFHLASNADPGSYAKYPVETITTNVLGSIHIINYARTHLHSRIVFTSSMEVYGENNGEYLQEQDYGAIDYNCIRAGYPESKRISELLYRSAVKEYGISGCIARLGYIYGPTMTDSDNKVIAQFFKSVIEKEDLFLKSAGTQNRTYCYVADAVTGLLTLMACGKPGEAYNVANKESLVTIRQLGELISKQFQVNLRFKYNSQIKEKSIGKHDVLLNAEKLEQLGWCAKTRIKDGIERTIKILQ